MKAQLVSENVKFERGHDPKKVMGIGERWKLVISTHMSKSAWYESYSKETSYRLYQGEELFDSWDDSEYNWKEQTGRLFDNYIQYLKSHGLSKKNVEVVRNKTTYDSGNYH